MDRFIDAFLSAWQTPILKKQLSVSRAFNEQLYSLILDKEKNESDIKNRINIGGVHTSEDLLNLSTPEIDFLKERIVQATEFMTDQVLKSKGIRLSGNIVAEAWANISRNMDYQLLHRHEGQMWSGVYYVKAEQQESKDERIALSGAIQFIDPRPGVSMIPFPGQPFGSSITIRPVDGLFLMFPSWLSHTVLPYYGDSERVSIAFNVSYTNFKIHQIEIEEGIKNINDAYSDNR